MDWLRPCFVFLVIFIFQCNIPKVECGITDEADLTDCNTFSTTSCSSAAGAASCYGERYLGCFVDQANNRVLPGDILINKTSMTISKCIQFCNGSTTANYVYAGVESGKECFCGETSDDYSRLGVGSVTDCQSSCSGDSTESCGGAGHIAVFSIDIETSETTPDVGPATKEPTTLMFLMTNQPAVTSETTPDVGPATKEPTTLMFLMTNQPAVTSDNKDFMTSSGITTDLLTPTQQQRGRDSCLGVGVGEGIVIILLLLTVIALVVYILRNRSTQVGREHDRDSHDMTLAKKSFSNDRDDSFYQDIEDVKTQEASSSPFSGEALYSSKIYEQKGGHAIDTMDMNRKKVRNNADPYIEII